VEEEEETKKKWGRKNSEIFWSSFLPLKIFSRFLFEVV
jgi:hypothetical protein